jgi:hypothetical protein
MFVTHGPRTRLLMRYPSGRVKQGYLADVTRIDGVELYGEVAFHESDRLRAGRLHGSQEVQGIPSCSGLASFYPSGRARTLLPSVDIERHGLVFKARQYVDLDETGQVIAGLVRDTRSFVRIGPDGAVTSVVLPTPTTSSWRTSVGERTSYCWFNPTGVLMGGGHNSWDDCANEVTYREFLHGESDEMLLRDFGMAVLREIRTGARTIFDATSDQPLEFVQPG